MGISFVGDVTRVLTEDPVCLGPVGLVLSVKDEHVVVVLQEVLEVVHGGHVQLADGGPQHVHQDHPAPLLRSTSIKYGNPLHFYSLYCEPVGKPTVGSHPKLRPRGETHCRF